MRATEFIGSDPHHRARSNLHPCIRNPRYFGDLGSHWRAIEKRPGEFEQQHLRRRDTARRLLFGRYDQPPVRRQQFHGLELRCFRSTYHNAHELSRGNDRHLAVAFFTHRGPVGQFDRPGRACRRQPPTKLVGVPPYSTTPGHIQYEDGCPDLTNGCTEYSPGLYTNPIVVIGFTAIFDPGVYYITGSTSSGGYCSSVGKGCISSPNGQCRAGFVVDSNGVVRPADPTKAPGDGSYGTLFYFSNGGGGNYESAFFGANAGKANNRTIDNFPLSIGANPNYPGLGMNCPGASAPQ